MIASVSHGLNNPIYLVSSILETARDNTQEEETKERLENAISGVNILKHILNDLLDYSKILLGNFELNIEEFFVQELIDEIIRIVQFQAKMKNVIIEKLVFLEKDALLNSDYKRVQNIIYNILVTALS